MNSKSKFAMSLAVFFFLGFCFSQLASAAPPTDACSLLTPAQVSAVLGVLTGPGKELLQHSTKDCGWPATNGPAPPKRVFIEIVDPSHWNFIKMPLPVKGVVKTPVTGIGDDAVYVTTQGFASGLSVKKGNFVFQVRVYGFSPEEIKSKEKQLALNVVATL